MAGGDQGSSIILVPTPLTETGAAPIATATAQQPIDGGPVRSWTSTCRCSDQAQVPLDPFLTPESGRPGSLQFPDSLCPPRAGSQRRGPRSLFTPAVVPLRRCAPHVNVHDDETTMAAALPVSARLSCCRKKRRSKDGFCVPAASLDANEGNGPSVLRPHTCRLRERRTESQRCES